MRPAHARIPAAALDYVERLHALVDELVAPLRRLHGERLRCRRGCAGCCVDGLTVFEVEAAVIARHHRDLLEGGRPGPPGGCAFLDADGACRIYVHRPYVCRTQGLPLRWAEEDASGAPREARDVCPLNAEGGPPVAELPAEACWTIGPVERRLAALQAQVDGGRGLRVALRDLFAR